MPLTVPNCKPGFRHCWHAANKGTVVERALCCWCGHSTELRVSKTYGHAHGSFAVGSN